MTETTIGGGSNTGGVYTPPAADGQDPPPEVTQVQKTQSQPNLTVSHQQNQNTANLATNQIGSDDLEPPMMVGDLSLTVTILFADLNQTRANQSVDMLKDAGKEIKKANKDRMAQIAKNVALLLKMKKKQKGMMIGQICGIIGGALIAAASLGTLSSVGIALVVTSVAISTATQVAQMTGGFDKLAEATNSKTAQGVMYGAMAVSLVLGMGAGASSMLSSAPEVAEELAETAAQTGLAMSEASSSAEAADILAEGISEMTTTLENAGFDTSQMSIEIEVEVQPAAAFSEGAGDAAGAGANTAESGVIDDAAAISDVTEAADNAADKIDDVAEGIDDTKDIAAQGKQQQPETADAGSNEGVEGDTTEPPEGPTRWQQAAKFGRNTGRMLEFGADVQQGAVKIQIGEIQRDQHNVQSEVKKDDAYIDFEQNVVALGKDHNKNVLDALSSSFRYMGENNQKFHQQGETTVAAIRTAGTGNA